MVTLSIVNPHQPLVWAPRPIAVPIAGWRPVHAVRRNSPPRPMLENRPTLGRRGPQLGVFTWSRVPLTAMLATGGVAALYVSGVFPSPVDVVLGAAGIAAVGYAIYHLFSASEEQKQKEEGTTPSAPVSKPTALAEKDVFDAVTGKIIRPKYYETITRKGSIPLYSQLYGDLPVEITLTNPDREKAVDFQLRILQTEKGSSIFGDAESKTATPVVSNIHLPPNSSQTFPYNIPTIGTFSAFQGLVETLTVQKVRGTEIQDLRDENGSLVKVVFYA